MSDYLTTDAQFNLLSPASKAVKACRTDPKLSYRKAAAMFRISKQTVINRDRGLNKSHKEARKAITRLTMIEEEAIADMALDLYKQAQKATDQQLQEELSAQTPKRTRKPRRPLTLVSPLPSPRHPILPEADFFSWRRRGRNGKRGH
jgi:hypothetical protein